MFMLYLMCLVVGVLVGMTGVGGILVPPVLLLCCDIGVQTAMGTALAACLPMGIYGTWRYVRMVQMDAGLAASLAAGGALGGMLGAILNARCHADFLMPLMAALIVFAGWNALRPQQRGKGKKLFWHGRVGCALVGVATGFPAALTGAGGPVLSIPLMIAVGFEPMLAVGLSMPYMVAVAFTGTLANVYNGQVNLSLLPVVCLLQLAGMWVGASLVSLLPTDSLRRLVGSVCMGLGVFLLVRQLWIN